MANIGYATLSVIPSAAGFGSALSRDINPQMTGVGHGAGRILGLGFLAGAAVIVAGIGAVIKTGVGEAMDASAGTAQLAAGIASTGNAANVTVDGMNALASSIQGYSGQTDDSIVQAENLLLTFVNIKNGVGAGNDIFDQATLASANMAAKMGGDASTNAIRLGRALNDPVAGVTALTRVGVQFTDAQKASIESMVASGDVMGAQRVILAELQTEFGGAAAAAGQSLPGQLAIAKRSFEDVSQAVVEGLLPTILPGLTSIGATITTKVIPAITEFIQGFKDGTGSGGTFRDVLEKVGSVLGAVGGFIKQNSNWLLPLAGIILGVVVAIQVWTGVQAALNVVMSLNPIGLIIIAIVALVAALAWAWNNSETFRNVVTTVWTGIQTAVGAVVGWFTGTLIPAFNSVWATVSPVLSAIGAVFTWVWNSVIMPIVGFIVGAIQAWATVVGWLWTNILSPIFGFIGAVVKFVGEVIIAVIVGVIVVALTLMAATVTWLWENVVSPIFGFIGAIFNWVWSNVISPVVGFIVGYIHMLGAVFTWLWENAISPAINFITGAFDNVKTAFGLVHDFFSDKVTAIGNIFSGIGDTISGAFKGVFNGIARAWNNSIGSLSWSVPDWVPVIGGDTISAPRIPLLASGALVTDPALAMLGESGHEAVLPFSRVDEFAGMVARQMAGMDLGKPDGRRGAGNLIDYDRLAAAMSRVTLTMDGRRVSQSADAWIGASIR